MQTTISAILDFWFGQDNSAAAISKQQALWFVASADTDNEIRSRFERHVIAALNEKYKDWRNTAHGCLALILLLDQFTRNIYRKSHIAYSGDTLAIILCDFGIKAGHDQVLSVAQRSFFYMPLEHSESLEHQEKSVQLFTKLVAQPPEEHQKLAENPYDYALQHHDIIARFNRFPHRNAVSGRDSTVEKKPTWKTSE
ncbi:MAG: hypothetical protein COC05_04905 [Gammaproteobacteria bacterium]|nr:MAG: hypothetical protein COC05_04905 [Gammaproteobacteria bacterium]